MFSIPVCIKIRGSGDTVVRPHGPSGRHLCGGYCFQDLVFDLLLAFEGGARSKAVVRTFGHQRPGRWCRLLTGSTEPVLRSECLRTLFESELDLHHFTTCRWRNHGCAASSVSVFPLQKGHAQMREVRTSGGTRPPAFVLKVSFAFLLALV